MRRRHILLLAVLLAAGCREEILHGLSELQANKAQLVLKQSGIDAVKVRDGSEWGLAVGSSLVGPALLTLEKSRIIARELNRFKEQPRGLIPSREERSQFRERQCAWNLEQTLERLPQVREARVHLFLESLDDLGTSEKKQKQSAGVLLLLGPSGAVDEAQIKKIVSGATGIAEVDVSVMLARDEADGADAGKIVPPVTAVGHSRLFLAAGAACAALLVAALAFKAASRRGRSAVRGSL